MKQKLLLKTMLLLCAIIVGGVSSVWADSYTITFANNVTSATALSSTTNASTVISNDGSRSYVTTKPFTIGNGNCYYGDTETCIRIGKSGNSSSLTIALSDAGKVKATSIVVNCNNTGGKNNSNAGLNVNSIGQQTTTETADDYTFTFASATDIENIVLAGTASIRIYSITVNYSSTATSSAPTIDDGEAASNFTISKDVTITAADGATIYYTTDGTDPTTSSSTYSSAIHITSTTTIKAAALEDGKVLSSISSKTFTKVLADNSITVTGGTEPSVDRTGGSAVDDWTPTASATSGGTISYAVKSTANLTQGTDFTFNTSTGKVSFLTAYKGTIVITASVAADDDYAGASQDITLTVNGNKRAPVIAYDGEDAEISNTGTLVIDPEMIETDGVITVESSNTEVATVSEYTISAVADGTTTITITTAAGTYYNAGSATFELTVVTPSACDIALTGAPVSKTFDVYNNATPQVINYTTSSTGAVSIASNAYASFEIDQVNKKITVTPKSKTPSAQTITINQAAAGRYLAGSTTFSLTVNNSATSETYEKVTNAATLAADNVILLVDETDGKAAGAFGDNAYMAPVTVTINSSTDPKSITITDQAVEPLKLSGTSSAWTLYFSDGKALYTSAAKKMSASSTNSTNWTIGISEGNATISTDSYGTIRYNNGSPRFLNYTSDTGRLPQIYKRSKYANVITVTNGTAQTLELEDEQELTLSATSYCGAVSFAYKSATNLTKDTDFTFDPSTGELLVDENASSGTITITASTVESATHKAASTDIVISVVGKPVDPDFSGISNQEIVAGGTYTLVNGEQFTTDGTVTLTTDNASIASVSGLVVTAEAVGTTTITVSAAKGTMYNAGSTSFNITVTAPAGKTTVSDVVLFNESFSKTSGPYKEGSFSGSSAYSVTADETGWTFTTENGGDGCAKFGSGSSTGSAKTRDLTVTNGKSYKLSFKCAPWDTGTDGVKVTVTGGTIDGKSSASTGALTSGIWNSKEYTVIATSTTMSFTFEKVGSENRFFLDDVVLSYAPTATVTLNKYGYATYCSVNPMDFSSTTGYTVWRVNSVAADGTITFKKVTEKIKGGQGVLLYNKNADGENTSDVTITFADGSTVFDDGSDTNDENDNLMLGTTAPTYVTTVKGDYTNFGLKGSEFLKINTGVIPTGKAYLPVPTSIVEGLSADARLTFVFEDSETTGISDASRLTDDGGMRNDNFFNLKGQRVAQPTKGGLYIVNGKKVVIK